MKVVVLCVGKLREKAFRLAADEYIKRLKRFGTFVEIEVPDLPEPEHTSPALAIQVRNREGEKLLKMISPQDYVLALCVEAPQMTSTEFSHLLAKLEGAVQGRVVLVIGGSLGLSDEVLARANGRLSLSKMTFPHQLFRVMLLEQLYRACKIKSGQRYHK